MTSPPQADFLRIADLKNADLIVDAVYEGGRAGNSKDDPLHPLLGVSNQGGFRILGTKLNPRLIVLTTRFDDLNWPDALHHQTGRFTYYGDNKNPGKELHDTGRYGNNLLKLIFGLAHSGRLGRSKVPPILVFAGAGYYRDVRFLGLAVPGSDGLSPTDDLVAVWKSVSERRFQNYRAVFTILDIPMIERSWINSLKSGKEVTPPAVLGRWQESGAYTPLRAPRSTVYRSAAEQLPNTDNQKRILRVISETFANEPIRFERCAGRICEMILGNVSRLEITRPSRDGGRDGIGRFRIGGSSNGVEVEFAIEAKCYRSSHSVGVRELSRLISRLRHRQFGVLVTTSYVGAQAYQEIKDDEHPIVIVAGRDIAEALEAHGFGGSAELSAWLSQF